MWALALCPREARYCAENSRRFAPAQGRALRYWAFTRRGGGIDAILSRALADWASYFGDGTLANQLQSRAGRQMRWRRCRAGASADYRNRVFRLVDSDRDSQERSSGLRVAYRKISTAADLTRGEIPSLIPINLRRR